MIKKSGITPMFNRNSVKSVLDNFQTEIDLKILQSMRYIGEQFVNKARLKKNYETLRVKDKSYTDRTGNLRSSIGYIILKDGQIVDENFTTGSIGSKKGLSAAKEVAAQHPKGFVLIGVAGMEYAAYVEAKNFDVITGSAPTKEIIKSILNEIKP